jgi:hypothetical protein
MISKNFLIRFFTISTASVLIGVIGGYVTGRFDDKTLESWHIKPRKIRILTEKEFLFPTVFAEALEAKLGYEVEVDVFEKAKSLNEMQAYFDIYIGSTCMIEKMFTQNSGDFIPTKEIDTNVSPDFRVISNRSQGVIPIFWHYKKDAAFEVYSIRSRPNPTYRVRTVLETLLTTSMINSWIRTNKLKSTYMSLDESDLPKDQKSSWLRTITLSDLSLLDRTSCANSEPQSKRELLQER